MGDKTMLVLGICLAAVLAAGLLLLPGKVHAMPEGWERPKDRPGQVVHDDDIAEYGTAAPRYYDWDNPTHHSMPIE